MFFFDVYELLEASEDENPIISNGFKISCFDKRYDLKEAEFEREDHQNLPTDEQWESVEDVELHSTNGLWFIVDISDLNTGLNVGYYEVDGMGGVDGTDGCGFEDYRMHSSLEHTNLIAK